MAHARCPSGHDMWNGDGKPDVWAFRVGFIRKFDEEHPDCVMDRDGKYWELYDCVDGVQGEDLDCWYCDECKGLTIFVDISRYDFKRMELLPSISIDEVLEWEEYIALRDEPFEDFSNFYKGMKPLEAIDRYSFEYRYRVSPDKKTIFAINSNGCIAFGYRRSCYTEFAPTREVTFKSYNPSLSWKDKLDIDVKVAMYASTKDGRTIIVDEIIEKGKLYRGRNIDEEGFPEVELKHEEIHLISDEIID